MIQANIRRENSITPKISTNRSGKIRANSTMPCAFVRLRDLWISFIKRLFMAIPLRTKNGKTRRIYLEILVNIFSAMASKIAANPAASGEK